MTSNTSDRYEAEPDNERTPRSQSASGNSHGRLLQFSLLSTSSLTVMAGATISPSLPAMQGHFSDVEESALLVRLVLTLPALFIALFAPIAGWVADRFGRRRLLFIATILYGISGTSGFFLDSLPLLLVSRAFLGMSVAGVITSATALISDYFQGPARARFMGFQAAFMGFGGVLFLVAGGLLSEWSWRGPFLVYSSAFIMAPAVFFSIYEPERSHGYSRALPDDPEKLHLPVIVFLLLFAFAGMVAFYLIPVQLPFFLESKFGAKGAISGMSIALATLVSSICSLNFGFVRRRFSHLMICVLICFFMGVGYVVFGSASHMIQVWIGLAICGLGFGMLMPNLNLWTAAVTPEAFRGRVLGALGAAIFLGQFFSPIITEPLRNGGELHQLYEGAGLALLLGGLGIVILNIVRKSRRRRPAGSET
ncbi:MAG: MFS transporter [Leptospiraceae bacterium]|nr:MFS transporter [Leptospiraceae bacterium]MCB1303615.1 MFS transporter [Leptospiraceae bacterium]